MVSKKFIKTSDEETRKKLIADGYPLLNKEGSMWVFMNIGKTTNFTEVYPNVVLTDYLYM